MGLIVNQYTASFAALTSITLLIYSQNARDAVHRVWSAIVHQLLCWYYPIKSSDGQTEIPTCPFSWPDGQGDRAKFLNGQQNRDDWQKEHGRIYRIWNGLKPEIVISDPKHIQNVFKDSDQHNKAHNNNTGWLLGELLGQCLGLISGTRWKNLRAVLDPSYNWKYISQQAEGVENAVNQFLDVSLPPLMATRSVSGKGHDDKKGFLVQPVTDMKLLAFNIIARKLYGPLTPALEAELHSMINLRESLFHQAITAGMLKYSWTQNLPTQARRDIDEFKRRWGAFNDGAYEAALARWNKLVEADGNFHDDTSAEIPCPDVVRMYNAVNDGRIQRTEALQTMDEILFANLDVTLGALSWVLVFIATGNQEAVRKEIQERKNATTSFEDGLSYLSDQNTLLHASMLEAGRLKPLAPFSVPQAPSKDKDVGGYIVPKGTDFTVDTYGVNIKNDFWGKDQESYRPERYLEMGKQSNGRYHSWRFGFGPRKCLGMYVAELIIKSTVVYMLDRYDLGLPGEETADDWKRKDGIWITQANATLKAVPRTAA